MAKIKIDVVPEVGFTKSGTLPAVTIMENLRRLLCLLENLALARLLSTVLVKWTRVPQHKSCGNLESVFLFLLRKSL